MDAYASVRALMHSFFIRGFSAEAQGNLIPVISSSLEGEGKFIRSPFYQVALSLKTPEMAGCVRQSCKNTQRGVVHYKRL